jgi:hypothetical protein
VIRRRFIGLLAAAKDSQVRKDRLNQNVDLKVIRDNFISGKNEIKGYSSKQREDF